MFSRFPVFLVGSVIGAAIDYLVTLLASSLLNINPLIALALSMIISGSFVFYFHLKVTFEDTQGKRFRRYIVFMTWTGVIYVLRALLLELGLFMGMPLAISLAVAIGLASIINFAFSSVFVFAKRQS
ncbi:MAG: GtrA family protein [Rhizobiaceae bacterium]|nr:GtrA family protein [Rhizobiaceae bacterium]